MRGLYAMAVIVPFVFPVLLSLSLIGFCSPDITLGIVLQLAIMFASTKIFFMLMSVYYFHWYGSTNDLKIVILLTLYGAEFSMVWKNVFQTQPNWIKLLKPN
uniref:1,3-beta-glucan synthase component bgs4 n=1 Tax=Anthurium amnicola TaxID=1678845 RepID=A0A1D1XDI5_9ARAE